MYIFALCPLRTTPQLNKWSALSLCLWTVVLILSPLSVIMRVCCPPPVCGLRRSGWPSATLSRPPTVGTIRSPQLSISVSHLWRFPFLPTGWGPHTPFRAPSHSYFTLRSSGSRLSFLWLFPLEKMVLSCVTCLFFCREGSSSLMVCKFSMDNCYYTANLLCIIIIICIHHAMIHYQRIVWPSFNHLYWLLRLFIPIKLSLFPEMWVIPYYSL